jgi:hypothetical protein
MPQPPGSGLSGGGLLTLLPQGDEDDDSDSAECCPVFAVKAADGEPRVGRGGVSPAAVDAGAAWLLYDGGRLLVDFQRCQSCIRSSASETEVALRPPSDDSAVDTSVCVSM